MSVTTVDRMRTAAGELWEQAITHTSSGDGHNQRLEFLGNAVLNLAIADHVYKRYPERESWLSVMCNYLRSDLVLNEVGRSIGLDAELRVGLSMNGKVVDSIVAGAVEAVIGAVYERSGYDGASVLVKELLLTDALVARAREHQDPISELKELVEARRWTPPKTMEFNSLIGERRLFYHSIELNGHAVMGMGSSKKKAKAQASRIMLLLLGPA